MKGGLRVANNNYTIYMHIFPSGKIYVGLTKQDVKTRWGKNGSGYKKNKQMYAEIQECGWDNIQHVILERNISREEASRLEKEYIKKFQSQLYGYNNSHGGDMGGSAWVTVFYNGKEYSAEDIAQLCADEVDSHDVTTRLGRGWDIEKIISQGKQNRVYEYEYNNRYYNLDELYELCTVPGLKRKSFVNRLQRGWDIQRALTQLTNKKTQPKGVGDRVYEYQGKYYNSYELCQISNVEGLKPLDITTRVNKHGWSVERAITQPKRKRQANK